MFFLILLPTITKSHLFPFRFPGEGDGARCRGSQHQDPVGPDKQSAAVGASAAVVSVLDDMGVPYRRVLEPGTILIKRHLPPATCLV